MNDNILKQVKDYMGCTCTNGESIIHNAILYEVAYRYDYIKNDYTDFDNADLTLDDLKEITDEILSSYYLNEGLNEVIDGRLFEYTDSKTIE